MNYKNQDVIDYWLPRFTGRNVKNAKIASWSRRGDYTVEYEYNKQIEDAERWGEDPNKAYSGQAYFTSKKKAEQFVKEIEESWYCIPSEKNPSFIAESSEWGMIETEVYKYTMFKDGSICATFGTNYAEAINDLHEWIKEAVHEHKLDLDATYTCYKTGRKKSHYFEISAVNGNRDKFDQAVRKKVYKISYKDAKKYLIYN